MGLYSGKVYIYLYITGASFTVGDLIHRAIHLGYKDPYRRIDKMALKVSPLTKIISLSSVLAAGFLMIVLAGAIYGNWFPVLIAFIFGCAHLPMLITGYYNAEYDDFMNEGNLTNDVVDFGKFISSFLLTTGVVFPIILYHCKVMTHVATVLTIIGGLLIYGTVVTFTTFFDGFTVDEDQFDL